MQKPEDLPYVNAFMVTGLSGAGISTALQVFEDLGYFTVDGLPVSLMYDMASMMRHDSMRHFRGIAIGISVQDNNPTDDFATIVQMLNLHNIKTQLLFFEATETELLRRYATTRRPHPLEHYGISLEYALVSERNSLAPLREMANFVLDTTGYSIHDLRRKLQQEFSQNDDEESGLTQRPLKVNIISFGFKYGVPREADMILDVRFLPNPHFEEELRPLSGLDTVIDEYVYAKEAEQVFFTKLYDFVEFTLGLMEEEGRYRVSLALGCTGGRHRSVATVQRIAKKLKHAGYVVSVEHRHMMLDTQKK